MSESPICDESGGGGDPFDAASDIFDLDSGFDVIHAQKPTAGARAGETAERFVFAVDPPRGGAALADQIDQFMKLFLGYHDDRNAPVRLGAMRYALDCPGGAPEAEALRGALARTLFDDEANAAVSVSTLEADAPDPAGEDDAQRNTEGLAPDDIEAFDVEAFEAEAPDGDAVNDEAAQDAAPEPDEDWLSAAASRAAHADGDTFDLDLLGPPPEAEPPAEPAPHSMAEDGAAPGPAGEPDEADTFRADMRAIAEAARGEDDAAAPVEDFEAALEGLIGDLDARLGATAERLEQSAAHVDERAREALSALLSAGESLRGYAQSASGGSEPGRLERMEAGLHAALDRLAEAQTAQETRIAERVIAALGGGTDADRAA